jgi:hypothetical protein
MFRSLGEEFRNTYPKSFSQDLKSAEGGISFLPLDRADVGTVEPAKVCKFFLRHPSSLAKGSDVLRKNGFQGLTWGPWHH